MGRAKWTFTLALPLVFVMSAAAYAAKPAAVLGPLDPLKIPQFVDQLDLLSLTNNGVPVALGADIPLSICEFQTQILPAGTPLPAAPPPGTTAGATWVWGYQRNDNDPATADLLAPGVCNNGFLAHSYLGPVVVASRGTPTTMTYYNRLPDVANSHVKAYTASTDQTLIWGDPLSLNDGPILVDPDGPGGNPSFAPINLYGYTNIPPPDPRVWGSEGNLCYEFAQANPGIAPPPPCANNYGGLPIGPTYVAPIPAAVHIHGGEVPAGLDGGPDAWWTPDGKYGHGYYSKFGTSDATSEGKAVYVYPNSQDAAPIWFHDHMLGATRLNVYAGIAGGYYLTDPGTPLAPGLHALGMDTNGDGTFANTDQTFQANEFLVPLIIQDRMFTNDGQLFFPNLGINIEHPYWVPEFVGDTILVNGKTWPNFNVDRKRYRFLVLNGSNARAYELYLIDPATGLRGPDIYVIANDQGYLDTPQLIAANAAKNNKLVIMPGERYEIIIDFSTVPPPAVAGGNVLLQLRNSARTPYPGGAPVNMRTTGRIMQFTVSPGAQADASFNPVTPVGGVAPAIRAPLVRLVDPLLGVPAPGVTVHKTRRLTLNEVIAVGGPLEILVNNTLYDGKSTRTFGDFTPITTMTQYDTTYYTELPHEGETELWEIVNLTADAHPMHPHLVAFQILNRQPFDLAKYTAVYNAAFGQANGLALDGWGPPYDYNSSGIAGCPSGVPGRSSSYPAGADPYLGYPNPLCILGGNPDPAPFWKGAPVPPAPQEVGWKDTVMAPSGWVTRVLVRFAPADEPVCTPDTNNPPLCLDNADSIGYPFDPNHGHGYVWHCHIVDHEDNEMMRPYTVQTSPGAAALHTFVKGTGAGQY